MKPRKRLQAGFSLIELVVAVSILAILSALAIINLTCFTRKARATTAFYALKQIYKECQSQPSIGKAAEFTNSNLNGYTIDSDGKSCGGKLKSSLIAAIPSDTENYPLIKLNANSGAITYEFRSQSGNDFEQCLALMCTPKVQHNPYFDPIHGDKCRQDGRTAMWTSDARKSGGMRLWTGCYDKNWKIIWDPCKSNYAGCESKSFRTNYGWFPCVEDGKKYIMNNRAGPPVTGKACSGAEPISDAPKANIYCWPPKEKCE